MTKSSTTQSLRDLALDTINGIAAELRKADPSLSKAQAVARAAQTPAGRSAYSIYKLPGAQQPWLDAVKSLTKGTSGSGPRGGRIEDPKITGPKVPGDMLKPPAQTAGRKVRQAVDPAAAIMTAIHEQAAAAAAPGTPEASAVASFLNTPAGAELHRRYNATMAAKRQQS